MPQQPCPACGQPLAERKVNLWGYPLHTCDACGAWHWLEQDAPKADYDQVYQTAEYEEVQFAQLEKTTDYTPFVKDGTYAPFFKRVQRQDGATLLDVGCGVGRFLRAASSQGWLVRGIDVATKAIAVGSRNASFPMSCESLEQIARQGLEFDAVTAFEVLEHIPEPVEFLSQMRSVTRPGGKVFVTVPNRECDYVLGTKRQDWLPPVHLHFYTRTAMQRLFERAGLANVETGFVMGSQRPTAALMLIRYATARLLNRVRPVPLGIWTSGTRA